MVITDTADMVTVTATATVVIMKKKYHHAVSSTGYWINLTSENSLEKRKKEISNEYISNGGCGFYWI